MPDTPSTHEEKVRTFWARYAEKAVESVGKPPLHRWLVNRAEAYVAAHPGRQLADQSPAEVAAYLAALGRRPRVTSWQVRQAANAIRIRLALAGVAWVHDVDWAHWQASALDLGPLYPTVARDYEAVAPAGASAAMPLAAIRAAHGPLLERASDRRGFRRAWSAASRSRPTVVVRSPAPTGYTAISGGPTPRSSATTNAIALKPMAWPEAGAPGRVPSTRMTAAIQVKGRYQRLFPPPDLYRRRPRAGHVPAWPCRQVGALRPARTASL